MFGPAVRLGVPALRGVDLYGHQTNVCSEARGDNYPTPPGVVLTRMHRTGALRLPELRFIGFRGSLPNEYTSPDACYCYTPEPKTLVQVALSVGG